MVRIPDFWNRNRKRRRPMRSCRGQIIEWNQSGAYKNIPDGNIKIPDHFKFLILDSRIESLCGRAKFVQS